MPMLDPNGQEYRVYWHLSDAVTIERSGRRLAPCDLPARYNEFKSKYFGDSVPELSDNFICVFQELPSDVEGATLIGADAIAVNVTAGIRINEKLCGFPSAVSVALLHEMAPAAGIRGHGDAFKAEIRKLWDSEAYLDPLIL